ncbi:MAG: ribosome maturation factor RimP [Propionibacteriaceae bacterium]|jgi:ribosome maturation factor RimP|nr:ribosome maturation factor RimP [Propionibacteriaceae bacterium]
MDVTALTGFLRVVAAQIGLEVDTIEVRKAGSRELLRVFLDGDGPTGHGPDLDQIASATKAISRALDESDLVGEQTYVLEVSTRGVSRPLSEPKHFRRNLGRLIAVTLADGTQLQGRIVAASESDMTLDDDGGSHVLGFGDIAKAVVQVELNRGVGSTVEPENPEADDPYEEE